MKPLALGGLLVCLAWSQPAAAHLATTRFGDFYAGLLHPLTSVEQLVPLMALALLFAQQGPAPARWGLFALPPGLLLGAGFALVLPNLELPAAWPGMGFVIPGLLLAVAWRLPRWLPLVVALLIGLVIGYENGAEIGPEINAFLFLAGVAAAGFVPLVIVAAAILQALARWDWARIALRALGSWIAAVGIMITALPA